MKERDVLYSSISYISKSIHDVSHTRRLIYTVCFWTSTDNFLICTVYVSSFLHWRFIYKYLAVLLVWKNSCILLCSSAVVFCFASVFPDTVFVAQNFFFYLSNKDFELKLKGTERDSHDSFCERGQRLQASLQRRLNINCNYACTIPSL